MLTTHLYRSKVLKKTYTDEGLICKRIFVTYTVRENDTQKLECQLCDVHDIIVYLAQNIKIVHYFAKYCCLLF